MGSSGDDFTTKTLSGVTLTDVQAPGWAGHERRGSLLVIAGAHADLGMHLLVDSEVVVGREAGDLRLRDGRVSRQHVRLWVDNGRYLVQDMGSTNGSQLNGRVIERATPLGDGDKLYVGNTVLKFTLVDETEAAYLRRMERMAGTDPLTGLHAKHRFDSMLEEAIRSTRLGGEPLWLLMMDMDGLKRINDAHGHRMGAHTISLVGRRIGVLVRDRGEACRFGGDEYCAFLPRLMEWEALAVAESIRVAVETEQVELDGVTVRATISIGLACYAEERSTPATLLAAADRALYASKKGGRNQVTIATD